MDIKHSLMQEERQFRNLAKDLPWPLQAEVLRSSVAPQRAGEAKPAADIDRRLSDVERKLERKLDLILETLGNQGREASKK